MKLKLISILIILFAVSIMFGGCYSANTSTSTPTPTDTGDYVIGSTESGIPMVLPTYTIDQPANINPGKIIGTVYISDKDHNFHKADCTNLGIINTPVNRQSAIIQGYSPCPVCSP
jgi:hypothetical protein